MNDSTSVDALAATSLMGAGTANVSVLTEWVQLAAAVIGILAGLAAIRLHLKAARQIDEDGK